MEDAITIGAIILALSLAIKAIRLIREILMTLLCLLGIVIAINFVIRSIIVPLFKGIRWLCNIVWSIFLKLCKKLDRHYNYRNRMESVYPDYQYRQ